MIWVKFCFTKYSKKWYYFKIILQKGKEMEINSLLTHFLLTVVFSFLIGLELKAYKEEFHKDDNKEFLGTTRTYTFIGIIAYILYELEPNHFSLYIVGFLAFTVLYIVFYQKDIAEKSIMQYLILLVVYSFAPLVNLYPLWFSSLIFVFTIFLLNSKNKLFSFKLNINTYELETFGKMVLLLAVILPLIPVDKNIPYLGISFYKVWLTIVVISGISYISYILQKYIFPSKGMFLTGLIGGVYSSTATVIVLSKKAFSLEKNHMITASILITIFTMYLRVLIIAYIFNQEVAKNLLLPILSFAFITLIIAMFFYKKSTPLKEQIGETESNPLELRTAFIFGILFVITMFITNYVVENFGTLGLQSLSFIVGLADINPFILSLLTGKYSVGVETITSAILLSVGANNIIKAVYSFWFGKNNTKITAFFLLLLGVTTILVGFYS